MNCGRKRHRMKHKGIDFGRNNNRHNTGKNERKHDSRSTAPNQRKSAHRTATTKESRDRERLKLISAMRKSNAQAQSD